MDANTEDVELLNQSGLLDPKWYTTEYPDVQALGMSPAVHYLKYGARLLRDPGPKFSTKQYLEANPTLVTSGVNPLVDHLRGASRSEIVRRPIASDAGAQKKTQIKGFFDRLEPTTLSGWAIDESRPGKSVDLVVFLDGEPLMEVQTCQTRNDLKLKGMNGDSAGFSVSFPVGLFRVGATIDVRFASNGTSLSKSPKQVEAAGSPPPLSATGYLEAAKLGLIRPVTVIVAIYNAHDAVAECLDSLADKLPNDADVLMMDDHSTDPRVPDLLTSFASRHGFRLHRNDRNLGYTKSVNIGISLSKGRDVVLLNSDTVVTARWLENLRYCAYATSRVATVTALSDNAGAFSVPEMGVSNTIPDRLSPEDFARSVIHAAPGRMLEVPTGNGFCLYIRRDAINNIGEFDEKKFPRGYGEENDLSMRAMRGGWKNLVCDKAFVFHKRSQSFQGEKAALMEAGAKQVNEDYPEYRHLIRRFRDAEFSFMRQRIRSAVRAATPDSVLPRALYVISTQTGGTPQTNLDLMRAMHGHFECFLLRCDASVLTISKLVDNQLQELEKFVLSRPIEPISHRSDEYDRLMLEVLYRYSIELLHIRHIAWHSLGLVDCAKSLGIPVVYSLHDFYSLCPSLNLLDEQRIHCGGKCTADHGECQPTLWPRGSLPTLKHRFITRWNEMFAQFMDTCDRLITTAPSAAETIQKIYPRAAEKLQVIPHGRDFSGATKLSKLPAPGETVRVLVPGNISISKGALLIKEMSELDKSARFEFHFLGDAAREVSGVGIHHGKYDRSTFADKVRDIAPHLGVVLSIWPETYCHTLTEMWSCGVPVLAIDLGAVGDRIREAEAGWLVSSQASARDILAGLEKAVDNAEDYQRRLGAVHHWQKTECVWNDTQTMAVEYRRVYAGLLAKDKSPVKRVVMVTHGELDKEGYEVLDRVLAGERYEARVVSSDWVLAGGYSRSDLVVIDEAFMNRESAIYMTGVLDKNSTPYILRGRKPEVVRQTRTP